MVSVGTQSKEMLVFSGCGEWKRRAGRKGDWDFTVKDPNESNNAGAGLGDICQTELASFNDSTGMKSLTIRFLRVWRDEMEERSSAKIGDIEA